MSVPGGGAEAAGSVAAAEARLEQIAPGYLARVRQRAESVGLPRTPVERARRSIELVAESAVVDPNPPTRSRLLPVRLLKRVLGKLMRFYILFLAEQVTDLGVGTSWMGSALCDYVVGLEAEVVDLRERVRRLEEGAGRP